MPNCQRPDSREYAERFEREVRRRLDEQAAEGQPDPLAPRFKRGSLPAPDSREFDEFFERDVYRRLKD